MKGVIQGGVLCRVLVRMVSEGGSLPNPLMCSMRKSCNLDTCYAPTAESKPQIACYVKTDFCHFCCSFPATFPAIPP